jgi:hypothetical protein
MITPLSNRERMMSPHAGARNLWKANTGACRGEGLIVVGLARFKVIAAGG